MTLSESDSSSYRLLCLRLAPLLRMRVNLKVLLALVTIGAFFTTVSYWSRCNDVMGPRVTPYQDSQYQQRGFQTKFGLQGLQKDDAYQEDGGGLDGGVAGSLVSGQLRNDLNTNTLEEIECLINGEYSISCRRDGQEVYVPFSFLHKYFEVYGKVVSYDGGSYDRFEWQHSYSKYYYPRGPYDPSGPFMHFKNYNVEARDRVKCISGIDGVPISTQWDAKGYHYPIQISQYGLSHYSKNLTDPEPHVTVYEDGENHRGDWIIIDSGQSTISYHWDNVVESSVMSFEASESFNQAGILIKLDKSTNYVLNLDFKFSNNGSFMITLEERDHHEQYYIHYVCSFNLILADGNHVYYGLGSHSQWSHLTRDISIDFKKGFNNNKSSKRTKFHFSKIKILHLTLRGSGALDNLTTSSSSHLAHFFDATSWLLKNQDEHGGWPIPVERKFSSMGMSNLQPGWYSAMAQGQAMSLLTRAYRITKDKRYLRSALKAVDLFKIDSQDHGVMTVFLDKYVWYEEYPTVPSSFVLNGFIYALLGLYDLHKTCLERLPGFRSKFEITCPEADAKEVGKLYSDGMLSLKKMLPLFDSGSTSIYDLRHFTLGIAPNLARWDYHTTHIDQLLLLATIDEDPILKKTALRWIEYMKGKRAAHN